MSSQRPAISICLPTYNRSPLLRQAMDSVFAQTFEDYELIISDNASEDDTATVVESYSDVRVKYSRNTHNLGVLGNFNRLLDLATGQYIVFFPDDDVMMPDNLAVKFDVLSRNPSVGLVHSKYHMIDSDGQIVKYNTNWGHGPERTSDSIDRGYDVLRAMLLDCNVINLPTVMFRRSCYERLGRFTDRLIMCFEWEYWMRIAAYYDVAFVAQPLIKWRFHPDSITGRDLLDESKVLTPFGLSQILLAKRIIVKDHLACVPEGDHLRVQVWRWITLQVINQANLMMSTRTPNLRAVHFILQMSRHVPEILLWKSIWKALVKGALAPQCNPLLKRIGRT